MNISKTADQKKLTVYLEGRLDTTTAPELGRELEALMGSIEELVLDFNALEYISSAGLRVLLMAQKAMGEKGGMRLTGVNATIREVFEITGFIDILTIE